MGWEGGRGEGWKTTRRWQVRECIIIRQGSRCHGNSALLMLGYLSLARRLLGSWGSEGVRGGGEGARGGGERLDESGNN